MIKIYYPSYPYKIKEESKGKEFIFDEWRRAWVRLTPEEWVRQNFIRYLIDVKKYPESYVAIERKITLGSLTKRFDILVFDQAAKPWMIVECKALNRPLDKSVLWQALHYNLAVPVQYLVLTNGEQCFGFERKASDFEAIEALPLYGQ